ncbi:hypothetical protein C7R57_03440 [Macrococcoides caseolyticum subsp. caseolyticum]|uniref:hypothetical protein n=1 Tax=Macrococcoides caseolyticum TaxID=69966 RepID=UPI000CD21753|nr:hypothetical protein [Macrococcus caseolyticus]PNZ72078.1 hypothetical protein CD152_08285 [Macrococcus caseolyticus]QPT45680.1 hypothetical protein I6G25_05430 [Macrococcus caseolyticus]RAK47587.1 hypothetical protein C7R57_03440 [Macrococcus caseolyticus subsp. caseolyticus]STY76162.1 Uncharacterised protein [Macrococcus caseolyticus]HCD19423.1 hypothetical protein [Macrococcus caseolyticus]
MDNIYIHEKIAKVKIPYENGIKEVYGHIIEYNERTFIQHGNGDDTTPFSVITYTYSDFETGRKIRSIDFMALELSDLHSKAKATKHIVEVFIDYVKPIIDKHSDKFDEVKKSYEKLNDKIIYENGELQQLLDQCEK